MFELLAQLARALADVPGGFADALGGAGGWRSRQPHGIASRTAGVQQRLQVKAGERLDARAVGQVEVDRGDAIRPAATAARSVPGTSWKPGSEP